MTPEKRLDQLEPIVAEVLQKVDRLIDTQGQLLDFSIKTKADLDQIKNELTQVKVSGDATARAVTNLTVEVNRRFDAVEQRLNSVDQRFDSVNQRFDAIDQRLDTVAQRFDAADQRFDSVDQRFDRLEGNQQTMQQDITSIKDVQQQILTLIQDKLK